jgi:hypothetical protein
MDQLKTNWITEGSLDFEYKKYILLAYLQHCRGEFSSTRLYPPLSELVQHYRNLEELRSEMESMESIFPREIKGLSSDATTFIYENVAPSDGAMATIQEIIEFAIPSIKETIHEGKAIYEFVESNIEIQPVGLIPVYNAEGYLLMNADKSVDYHVYQYKHSVITAAGEHLQSLALNYMYTEHRSLGNTVEQMKLNLASHYKALPNPATFVCYSKLSVPLTETLLPVTKRLFLKSLVRFH